MTRKPNTPTTYDDLKRAALLDLAARVVADPDADPRHVEAARRDLEAPALDLGAMAQVASQVPLHLRQQALAAWQAIVQWHRDHGAYRR